MTRQVYCRINSKVVAVSNVSYVDGSKTHIVGQAPAPRRDRAILLFGPMIHCRRPFTQATCPAGRQPKCGPADSRYSAFVRPSFGAWLFIFCHKAGPHLYCPSYGQKPIYILPQGQATLILPQLRPETLKGIQRSCSSGRSGARK